MSLPGYFKSHGYTTLGTPANTITHQYGVTTTPSPILPAIIALHHYHHCHHHEVSVPPSRLDWDCSPGWDISLLDLLSSRSTPSLVTKHSAHTNQPKQWCRCLVSVRSSPCRVVAGGGKTFHGGLPPYSDGDFSWSFNLPPLSPLLLVSHTGPAPVLIVTQAPTSMRIPRATRIHKRTHA